MAILHSEEFKGIDISIPSQRKTELCDAGKGYTVGKDTNLPRLVASSPRGTQRCSDKSLFRPQSDRFSTKVEESRCDKTSGQKKRAGDVQLTVKKTMFGGLNG